MTLNQIEELRKEYEDNFVICNPETDEWACFTSDSDPDDVFNWFISKITSREEEVRREERKRIKRIFETMWETGKPAKGDDIGNGVVYGWNDCLTNCIAQVDDSLTPKAKDETKVEEES